MKVIKDERLGVKLEYGISYFAKRKKSKRKRGKSAEEIPQHACSLEKS